MIHSALSLFLLLGVAHLAADFALQPAALVAWKGRSWAGAFFHAGIFAASAVLLALLTGTLPFLWPWILALWLIHAATDRRKISVARNSGNTRCSNHGFFLFLVDQVLHFLALAFASAFAVLASPAGWSRLPSDHLLVVLNAYLLVIFAFTVGLAVFSWEVLGSEQKGIPPVDWLLGGWERGVLLTSLLFQLYWLLPLAFLPRLLAFRKAWHRAEARCGFCGGLSATILVSLLVRFL